MQRLLMLTALVALFEGCGSTPVLRKQTFDFKTTALFKLPCDSPEVLEAKHEVADDGLETEANKCNSVHMLRMVDRFMTIQETDESHGILGDTIAPAATGGRSRRTPTTWPSTTARSTSSGTSRAWRIDFV
ncbi:MAG TPA: hypothetical protein VFQ62_22605 [Methylomirabilota bacterium]|nr:hypothetical protein [Methylomirabilota bacterium]